MAKVLLGGGGSWFSLKYVDRLGGVHTTCKLGIGDSDIDIHHRDRG